jgi:hypothetical protein
MLITFVRAIFLYIIVLVVMRFMGKREIGQLSLFDFLIILTIADIYDALTSVDRPYKIPMPREKAFSILEAMVGEGKLDGQLVKWFEEAMEYFYKETKDEKDK